MNLASENTIIRKRSIPKMTGFDLYAPSTYDGYEDPIDSVSPVRVVFNRMAEGSNARFNQS
jgi:hypothetical protein